MAILAVPRVQPLMAPLLGALGLLWCGVMSAQAQLEDAQLGEDGFAISTYEVVPGARQLAVSVLDPETGANIVYVGTGSSTGMIWSGSQES